MAASSRPAQDNHLRGEAQKPCRQAGLFAIQECILFGATIYFAHELTLIQFTQAHRASIAGTRNRCRNGIDGNQCAKTQRSLERNFTISRAEEYRKIDSSLSV
jgi:hypothetical protein